jgi:hypothetical protein
MNYINKLTSCREVIFMIERTLKPQGSSWIAEAMEDIGWAIQGIGYHAGFEHKSTDIPYITVANNRAKIPADVERIEEVELLLPSKDSYNLLNPDGTTPLPSTYEAGTNYKGVPLLEGSDTTSYGVSPNSPRTTGVTPRQPYYNLNGDYIQTSFTDGLIKLHYIGFFTDNDGLPKIIDDFDYKTACQWYCIQNMLLKGYSNPNISFKDAFQMWDTYRLRAENAVTVPTLVVATKLSKVLK